ncbi:MAG: phage baseplate assembly protein V [Bacteroidales bacterium]|nr:phage baseplate assembly protein V [Bacteroidales bacterium]
MLSTVNGVAGPLVGCKVTPSIQNLQLLTYSISNKEYEVLQPYRVQYNEDFYSFISRVACRCGEFLYFEDGKLKLGLDNSKAIEIKTSETLRMEYPSFGNSSLTVTNCFRNYLSATTDGNSNSTASLPSSDYGAFDEYFDVLDKGSLPDSWGDEFYWAELVNYIKDSILPCVTAGRGHEIYTTTEKIAKAAVELAIMFGSYGTNAKYINDKFKEFFNTSDTQQVDGNKLSQFADARRAGYGRLLNKQLAEIRNKEMKAAREMVRIRVKTGFAAEKGIKLGSKINIKEGETKMGEYRVVSCTGQYSQTKIQKGFNIDGTPRYIFKITDITEFELVPHQQISLYTENDTGTLSGTLCIPPYDKCAESAPASPQIAVVTADNDPRYIGRVRVRYPWQGKEDAGSPWVRVLAPLASKSGAVHFQPKKDDEVLLGYIDGNIDRPYVAGSLFNDKKTLHDCLFTQYNDTIRVGSQRLDFRSGSIANWFESLIPLFNLVTPFIGGYMTDLTKLADTTGDFAKNLHGITRLTDKNGIWKIEGNTAARTVTIKSAWGKVKINAYTGIEIESTGDISIKGRNISIRAQDRIKIESGVAIKNARKSEQAYKDKNNSKGWTILAGIGSALSDLAGKSLDLSLPRVIFDSINPPKDGTLEIKSNRYLLLEAGKGEAYDDNATKTTVTAISNSYTKDLNKLIQSTESYIDCQFTKMNRISSNIEESNQAGELLDTSMRNSNIDDNFSKNNSIINEMRENPIEETATLKKINNEKNINNENSDLLNYLDININKNLQEYESIGRALSDIIQDKPENSPINKEIEKVYREYLKKKKSKGTLEDCKNYVVHTMIGKYINDTGLLKMDVKPDKWEDSINSITAEENKLKKWYLESSSWKSDYKTPFYIDTKSLTQGHIIMSEEEGHSIMMSEKSFKQFENVESEKKSFETLINNVKQIINLNYEKKVEDPKVQIDENVDSAINLLND